jgi:hypothetical protein
VRLFLPWLFFGFEDGSDTFLRKVGLLMDYTALYPRIWQHCNYRCENLKSYYVKNGVHGKPVHVINIPQINKQKSSEKKGRSAKA